MNVTLRVHYQDIVDLTRDLQRLPGKVNRGVVRATALAARKGAVEARRLARGTARKHGKHYPKSIDFEAIAANGLAWEYGPDSSMQQGDMSFEWGSKNQPPHRDLNNAADMVTPRWVEDIRDVYDEAIW